MAAGRRRWTGVGAITAIVALAGACGSAGSTAPAGSDHPSLAAAYAATTRTNSAHVSYLVTVAAKGHTVTVDGSGAFSYQPEAGSLTLHLHAASASPTIQERLIGSTVYVEVPAAEQTRLGAAWLEISGLPASSSTTGIDPDQTLALLEADSSGLHRVGPATVGGTATTEYAAQVELTKAAASQHSAFIRKALQAVESSTGLRALPVDVWIDGAGRVRQLAEHFAIPAGASGQLASVAAARFSITLDLSDFGVAVHVTAPPASSVHKIDASSLVQG